MLYTYATLMALILLVEIGLVSYVPKLFSSSLLIEQYEQVFVPGICD